MGCSISDVSPASSPVTAAGAVRGACARSWRNSITRSSGARSETEARVFHLCVDAGLPRPLVNRMVNAGGEEFEVDLHWPDARLIVEVDSPYRDATAARRRDPRRDRILSRSGWTVIRCRWADVVHQPERLIAQIRRHLTASGAFAETVSGKAPLAW